MQELIDKKTQNGAVQKIHLGLACTICTFPRLLAFPSWVMPSRPFSLRTCVLSVGRDATHGSRMMRTSREWRSCCEGRVRTCFLSISFARKRKRKESHQASRSQAHSKSGCAHGFN